MFDCIFDPKEKFCRWKPIFVECHELLNIARERNVQYDVDGVNNIWLLKPGHMSQGKG